MPATEGEKPPREPRRVKKGKTSSAVSVNPGKSPTVTARLDAMTRERVDALEDDKHRLIEEVEVLRARVDQLAPATARLEEALSDAESTNVLSTILMVFGGFLVSYAGFTGQAAKQWANAAAGCLLAGILVMLWQAARRWRRG